VDSGNINVGGGYNDEDDYYFVRCTVFMGSVLLQNQGVAQMLHDDSQMDIT
jgi:hypothetical protein